MQFQGPNPRALLDTVETLKKPQHPTLRILARHRVTFHLQALRNLHVNLGIYITIQKGSGNIHCLQLQIFHRGNRKYCTYGSHANGGCEYLIVVDTLYLRESLRYDPALVFIHRTIQQALHLEYPARPNRPPARGQLRQDPSAITNMSVNLRQCSSDPLVCISVLQGICKGPRLQSNTREESILNGINQRNGNVISRCGDSVSLGQGTRNASPRGPLLWEGVFQCQMMLKIRGE